MRDIGKDLRFAVRMLLKSPLVTAAAVLSLALGIGANTTIFSLVNAVLWRSLPVHEPGELVALYTTEEIQQNGNFMPISRPNYRDLRDGLGGVFSHVSGIAFTGAGLSSEAGEAQPVGVQMVSSNYFETLGVEAALGTYFTDQGRDEELGSEPFAILGHRLWSERFGGDTSVIGSTIRLNRETFTVLGVAPPEFKGTFVLGSPDLWVPISMRSSLLTGFMVEAIDDRRALVSFAFARLKEGKTIDQAQEALLGVGSGLREQYPVENKDRGFTAVPLAVASIGPNQQAVFERTGFLLLTVVGLVLLIACANVANLLLGRAAARRREIAVRLALGASRSRLVRQLLCESLVLASVAGALGLAFAGWARHALWAMRPPFLGGASPDLSFDPRVLSFTLGLSLLTGILFGLAPAIRFTGPALIHGLTQASDSADGLGRIFSFRNLLLIGQVALSVIALVGSGLFLRSLGAAMEVDLGYRPDGVASIDLNVGQAGYDEQRGKIFFDQVLDRARRVPGVKSASLTTIVPLTGGGFWRTVIVEGRDESDPNHRILVPVNTSDPGLLGTLGVRLERGRDFGEADHGDALPVAMVNQAMANRFWPDQSPIGERFHFIGQDIIREVVGVVQDSKHQNIGESPQPQVYVPRAQNYQALMSLALRTEGDPASVLSTVSAEIQALDGELPITNPQTGEDVVQQGLRTTRLGASLLGILGSVALLLAAIGIYGVMSYTVSQRDREISIRMALGADRSKILRLVLSQGMAVVGIGLVLGLILAAFAARGLSGLLYGVPPTDLPTLVSTAALLLAVAFVANILPARRATGVDPTKGLRFER